MDDLFSGPDVEVTYGAIIRANGDRHIYASNRSGSMPVSHTDPDLLRWMGENGYSCKEEIPVIRDDRPVTTCERCGARGIEVHHTFPKEWWSESEADQWPMANLCAKTLDGTISCHAAWHMFADHAAAKQTVRQLRQRGMQQLADTVERALKPKEATMLRALHEIDIRRARNRGRTA